MKSPLTTILLATLAIFALASVVLSYLSISRTMQLRAMQPQVIAISSTRPVLNALVNDALEYSKQHPDIEPILASAGINKTGKPGVPPVTNKPAKK